MILYFQIISHKTGKFHNFIKSWSDKLTFSAINSAVFAIFALNNVFWISKSSSICSCVKSTSSSISFFKYLLSCLLITLSTTNWFKISLFNTFTFLSANFCSLDNLFKKSEKYVLIFANILLTCSWLVIFSGKNCFKSKFSLIHNSTIFCLILVSKLFITDLTAFFLLKVLKISFVNDCSKV